MQKFNNENTSSRTEWTNQLNLSQAQKLKQQGNIFFTQKQYKDALKKYHQALLHLAGIIDKNSSMAMYTKTASQQLSTAANSLKYSIWLNMSQIYIYQQKFEKGIQTLRKAEELLNKSLTQQIKNKSLPKLYYRKGICYTKLNYFDEARKQFQKLKQIDQTFNKDIEQYEKEIRDRQKITNEKSKKFYQGFFK